MEKLKEEKLKKFGLHIKQLRTDLNLSQDNVALNSDKLIKATISDIENGKRNLSFTTLLDLAKGLGKHPKELLDFDFDLKT
ncbi:helix-turn-helix transcriptional regulator [Flavobacterium aquidurense]|uniref:helix-turn-helix domain-containing protein n=1 Tax=Flavobacterium aquidurense TaxID=362413 RepID=UPI0028544FC5|nr:helix-turn-helix transcriptional regulator [Flavobacterium aquidurense]MDR7371064.1 transcriptional regulator with XRE-family HTH domain [Flavobacterium aquidurense]